MGFPLKLLFLASILFVSDPEGSHDGVQGGVGIKTLDYFITC